jgi:hypothetical protein
MAQIMGAADRLYHTSARQVSHGDVVGMRLRQLPDQPTRYLRNLKRVCQPCTIEVAVPKAEDLSLALQAPE